MSSISRRGVLRAALLAPAARALVSSARPERVTKILRPVTISPDRVVRTVAGLRPFRPSGFSVRGENIGDKVIVHNYGHGGAGITLSWGTAHLAALEALATEHRDAAVIGGGDRRRCLRTFHCAYSSGARVPCDSLRAGICDGYDFGSRGGPVVSIYVLRSGEADAGI